MAPLEPELDAMLRSALIAAEAVYLRVQSAPGEAIVLTQFRVIVLKAARRSSTGKAFGRFFALDEIVRFDCRGWLGVDFIAVITRVTQRDQIPAWNRWKCTFGVTFSSGLGAATAGYLRSLEAWLAGERRAALLNGPLPTVTPVGVAVHGGEAFHIQVPAVYYEEKAIREYSGGYSGVSVPVMRGVRVRVGGSRGTSWTTQVLQQDDAGSLLIGSRRVVFVGARRTISVSLDTIATVEAFIDGVGIGVANKPIMRFKTEDDLPGLLLKRVLNIP